MEDYNMPHLCGLCSWNGRKSRGLQAEDGSENKVSERQQRTCLKTCQKEKKVIVLWRWCKVIPQRKNSSARLQT